MVHQELHQQQYVHPCSAVPVISAIIGTTVSGSAMPMAANRPPTVAWERLKRSPIHSTPLAKNSQPPSITNIPNTNPVTIYIRKDYDFEEALKITMKVPVLWKEQQRI